MSNLVEEAGEFFEKPIGQLTGGLFAGDIIRGLGGGGPAPTVPGGREAFTGFTTPGLTARPGRGGVIDITRTPETQAVIDRLQATTGLQAAELGELRGLVRPGIGELTETSLRGLESRRRRAIGNLRENLARRRVLGSSFAQDVITRTEREFAEEEAGIKARSFLTELQLTTDLINRESQANLQGINSLLSQFQFEAGLGAQISSGATAAINNAAALNAQLAAQAQAGQGQLLGNIIGGGALILAASDKRTKENINPITIINGVKWYMFNYIGSKIKQLGVMAHEVPWAARKIFGINHVNYGRIYV